MDTTTNKHPKAMKATKIILTVSLGFLALIIAAAIAGSNMEADKPKASYSATAPIFDVVDPATVRVAVIAKNTSDVAGKPTCNVTVNNAGHSYTGFDTFEAEKELKPGEEWKFGALVTVTGQGAAYITETRAECK